MDSVTIIALISLIISIVSLISTTCLAIISYKSNDKQFKLQKKDEFFRYINTFLLAMEYEITYHDCPLLTSKYTDAELDRMILEAKANVQAFATINKVQQSIIDDIFDNINEISDIIQDSRAILAKSKSLQTLLKKSIRSVRSDVDEKMKSKDFIKLK